MAIVVQGLAYATLLVQLAIFFTGLVFAARKLGLNFESRLPERAEDFVRTRYREISLLISLVAASGSLYLSNILGWEPCRLCWFQRITLYPLVVLLGVSLLLDKDDVSDYVLPLTMIGIPISTYHYIVQRVEQFHSAGCSVLSVSCSTKYTFYFGYITIPMMALTALVAVLILTWRFSGKDRN